jgi:hypothetical protein
MSQCSSVLVALLLLTSSAALAKDKPAPKPDVLKGMPEHLQLIGWSKDEEWFAVRKYILTDDAGVRDDEFCSGYVNHRGKPFHGGLSIELYKGGIESQSWEIQSDHGCTPPEKARDKLAAAKAALAQRGIDPSVIGTVVPVSRKDRFASTGQLTLPSGPWKGQTLEVEEAFEITNRTENEEVMLASTEAKATFTVSLRSGKELTQLAEYPLSDSYNSENGSWSPSFEAIVLSPSGERFVAIGHLSEGHMRGGSKESFVFGLVELPERDEAPAPKSKAAR